MRRSRLAGKPEWQPLSVFLDDGVVPRSDRDDNHNQLGADLSNYLVVEPGDLVFNKLRTWQGGFGHSRFSGIVSPAYYVLRPTPALDTRFMDYLLHSSPYLAELTRLSKWMPPSQFDMPWDELKTLPVPLPPLDVQRRIADFLDDQVERIDGVIAARERMVGLVAERAASEAQSLVLARVDTQPIRTDAGPVLPTPPGWIARKNKTFMREVVDLSQSGAEEMLTVSHLTGVTPRSEKTVYMFEVETNVGYKRVQPGDLVINTLWAWMGALGVARKPGIVSPAYGVYRFTEPSAEPRYFDALFRSNAYVTEMTRYSKGVWSSRLRLYPDSFLALTSPFPPYDEQLRIADAVEASTEAVARRVAPMRRSIDLLGERKRSLITAAVTGEFDVSSASSRATNVALSGVGGVG